jgi:hypothetical protein
MKKIFFFSSAALLVATIFCLQSCDFFKKGGAGANEGTDSLSFCTVMYEDTMKVVDAYVSQNMKVDFPLPEAKGVLADTIRAYLVKAVANNYFPLYEEADSAGKTFEYKVGDEEGFLSAYAGEGMTRMVAEVTQMAEDGWATGYYNNYTASISTQTEKYVTLEEAHEIFTGGAHGAYIVSGITFRVSDGARMGWNLFDMSKKSELIALLKKGVMEYLEVSSEEELQEQLQVWDDPDTPENELEFGLPLPRAVPYLTSRGVAFVYQQYEIACYAVGLPSVTIPVEELRDLLSEEGRALLDVE